MIKLSKKGSYALKAVIYIAKSEDLVHISDIAEAEDISLSMLRRIIANLEKAGVLETIQGRNGGIKLGKKVHQISVFDILFAVGEELGITDCTKGLECDNQNNCSTEVLLGGIQKGFNTLLHIYTLDKIIK
ncbi:Rrf2 family transcriptional regulator [Candidatus Gracilibacteria bacterium]|nr:Rrf2 family transcriptional regulator [Candidatus Gracilibacteria bacterium]